MRPAREVELTKRRSQAVALKLGGATWQQIADQLGYSDRGAACKDVSRALEQSRAELRENAEELRTLQHERYQRLLMAVWPMAVQGDLRANEQAARLVDRITNLLGLNAPIQHEVITVDAVTARIRDLSEQLGLPVPERFAITGELAGEGSAALPPGAGDPQG